MLEMMSDALTNAGKHASLIIAIIRVASKTQNIQSSNWLK